MEKYTRKNMIGYRKFSRLKYRALNSPKISIVITVFNGEGYINPVICSIQNQNFLDLEIIIVDDFSKDNSVLMIKELMKEDPRIILLENTENRGTLYSKSKGVSYAKGKYVITLDHDNLYSNKYTFSILYEEAENNNLDLLGFSSIITSLDMQHLKEDQFINYIETSVIEKPLIQRRFFNTGKIESSTSLCLYLAKTELYRKVLNKIGKEMLNRNIDSHDDTIVIFLLTKYAKSLKHIKRVLHLILAWPNIDSPVFAFQRKNKIEFREMKQCFSTLTFNEVLYLFTENNKEEKNIAAYYFWVFYLNFEVCKKSPDKNVIKEALRISNLFLNNKNVDIKYKNLIRQYLRELQNQVK
jgi:glycosyltransferase involved in cell wall biosynthesis